MKTPSGAHPLVGRPWSGAVQGRKAATGIPRMPAHPGTSYQTKPRVHKHFLSLTPFLTFFLPLFRATRSSGAFPGASVGCLGMYRRRCSLLNPSMVGSDNTQPRRINGGSVRLFRVRRRFDRMDVQVVGTGFVRVETEDVLEDTSDSLGARLGPATLCP